MGGGDFGGDFVFGQDIVVFWFGVLVEFDFDYFYLWVEGLGGEVFRVEFVIVGVVFEVVVVQFLDQVVVVFVVIGIDVVFVGVVVEVVYLCVMVQ